MTPTITMHAMVRYLERKHGRKVKRLCAKVRAGGDHAVVTELVANHGLDQGALEREMLAPAVVEAFQAGATAVKHDGVRFVFQGHRIVTVTPTGSMRVRHG